MNLHDRSIGKYLKSIREENNFTIEYISEQTKIRKEVIEKIENDEFAFLGSDTYAKGLIKKYVEFLGESNDKFLTLYKRDYENYDKRSKNIKNKRIIISNSNFRIVGLIFIIIFFLIIVLVIRDLILSPPKIKITSPFEIENTKVFDFQSNLDSIQIQGESDKFTNIFINEELIKLSDNNVFKSRIIPLQNYENKITIKAINNLNIESELVINIKRDDLKNVFEKKVTLRTIRESTLLNIISDGIIIYNDFLNPENAFIFSIKNNFEILVSTPQDLTIFFEGQEYKLDEKQSRFEIVENKLVLRR